MRFFLLSLALMLCPTVGMARGPTPAESLARLSATDVVYTITSAPLIDECIDICICYYSDQGWTTPTPNACPCQRDTYCSGLGKIVPSACCKEPENWCVSLTVTRVSQNDGCCIDLNQEDPVCDQTEVFCSTTLKITATYTRCCTNTNCTGGIGLCTGAQAVNCSGAKCCPGNMVMTPSTGGPSSGQFGPGQSKVFETTHEMECGDLTTGFHVEVDCATGGSGGFAYSGAHGVVVLQQPKCEDCCACQGGSGS